VQWVVLLEQGREKLSFFAFKNFPLHLRLRPTDYSQRPAIL
jgi:hypothetical protein